MDGWMDGWTDILVIRIKGFHPLIKEYGRITPIPQGVGGGDSYFFCLFRFRKSEHGDFPTGFLPIPNLQMLEDVSHNDRLIILITSSTMVLKFRELETTMIAWMVVVIQYEVGWDTGFKGLSRENIIVDWVWGDDISYIVPIKSRDGRRSLPGRAAAAGCPL
jgi:hypothetical protein